jgi:hypothetical protein
MKHIKLFEEHENKEGNKTLEIMKDKDMHYTRYFSVTNGVDKYFEDGPSPLRTAKKWAKDHGYTHLTVISTSFSVKDRTYEL